MRVLVLGASGMLGNAVFRVFSTDTALDTWGTLRSQQAKDHFADSLHQRLLADVDVLQEDRLQAVLLKVRPGVVINCVGFIKQQADADNPLAVLPVNAMLPHRLAALCGLMGSRLIHVSTDCVFSGRKGFYKESDLSDAEDLYGRSKHMGEVSGSSHAITLRTSIIGHELSSRYALVDWFLSREERVKGFARAVFSGLPTVELARVMKSVVLPRPDLSGLYHVAAQPITKLDLLRLVAGQYGKRIDIVPDDALVIDRSLDGSRFEEATGYVAPSWPELVAAMHNDYKRGG